jgi:hypothetical protein
MIDDTPATATNSGRDPHSGRFLTAADGNGGGPGRKVGSRNRLTTAFLDDLHATWQAHGRAALEACALVEPAQFCRIVAGLLPREAHLDMNLFADAESFRQAFDMALDAIGTEQAPRIGKRRLLELEAEFSRDE